MPRRARFAFTPGLLGLEGRAVPTVVSPLAFGGAGALAHRADSAALAKVSAAASPGGTPDGLNFSPNPEIDPTTLSNLGKIASRFTVAASGPYALAGSYYASVAKQMVFLSKFDGTTGQMRHGTMIMRVVIPADPSGTIFGLAVLRDLSSSTTGNQLVLDLTATAVDAQGRPTHFTWDVDATSAGSYTGAPGNGTLDILYKAHGKSKSSAGGYSAVFRGSVLPDPTLLNTLYDIPKFN